MKAIEAEHPAHNEWKERELARLSDGTYQPLPSVFDDLPLPTLHFAHVGTDGASIAFTESPEKGRRDRQTTMRPGRYLARVFSEMTGERVQELTRAFHSALHVETVVFKLTTDKDMINRVFETYTYPGADGNTISCMCGKSDDRWWAEANARPYHVYAGSPDVAVAYLENDDNDVVARTVINVKDKKYVRIYAARPDIDRDFAKRAQANRWQTFKNMLKDEGYTHGDLSGCHLTPTYDNRSVQLLPYIDGEANQVEDEGRLWVVGTEGCWSATGTNGYPEHSGSTCEHCDDIVQEDLTYIEYNSLSVCDHCINYHYTEAITDMSGNSIFGYQQGWVPEDSTIEDCQGELYSNQLEDQLEEDDDGVYHDTENCGHREKECNECGETSWDEDFLIAGTSRVICSSCYDALVEACPVCSPEEHS